MSQRLLGVNAELLNMYRGVGWVWWEVQGKCVCVHIIYSGFQCILLLARRAPLSQASYFES